LVLPVEGFLATIDPADRPAVTRQIDQATRNGGRFEVQYRMVRPDGSVRWVQASGHCDLDAAGQPVRVPGVLVDVHDRVEAELAVAAKVSRQAALIRLGDQLRDAADLAVISDLAAAAGEALGLNNLGYVEVDPQHGGLTVLQDGSTVGAPGRFEPSAFPSVMHRLQRGAAVVEADLAATEWLGPGERDALQALGIQALVNVPLMRDGQLVGAMFAGSPTPRAWSDDEVRFIHDVADRTWAASERVQVETALRASAAELQLVADSMPVLITMIDRSLVYRFVNRASVDWFGVPPEAVIGVPARDVLGTEGFAWRHPYFAAALAGQASKVEAEWPHPDGRPRTAEISYLPRRAADGTTDGLYSLVVDVTERKRAEQVLQLSAEALEAEVARRTAERDRMWTLSTDIMLVASFDGAIEAVNPAWSSLLGWPAAELIGSNFFDLVHPEDLENTRAEAVLLSQGRRTITFENRYRHRDGSYRWISWSAAPGEQLIHAAGRDITEERERQALQRSLEEQLRQSQKMEAVGQLTGGLAHDFNNLLTAITGSLEMLQVRIAQGRTDDIERYATVARGAASRAAALTHRLLAFSRRQTLDPKPTQINRLVADMEDLIKRTVGPAIHLETVLGVGLWLTLCDQNQLENALLNLCINARDAMAAGGRLTVETANVWLDERGAQERDMIPGQYVGLSVTDSGTGMTPDVAARAFDPFFTTKPMGEGTGLGLSMIYGFVRQSGGQVRIYSELGHGSTIQLYLPRHHAEVQPDVELTPAEAPRAEQGETVLVVDDEPTIRLLVGEVLGELGYGAIEASDGPSALAVLQSGHRIDLMITDVGLPGGMNGRQLADAARQWRPALKVLFITGYAANGAVGNGYLQPGMHVMTKPFAMDALAVKIRTVIAG
jgi:PAS domain S-box-containing protein